MEFLICHFKLEWQVKKMDSLRKKINFASPKNEIFYFQGGHFLILQVGKTKKWTP